MKKFSLFLITVIVVVVTVCVCFFVFTKKDGNEGSQNNTDSDNKVNLGDSKYEEITAKYDNEEDWIKNGKDTKVAFSESGDGFSGLSVTGIEKNSDGTYTIKGVVYAPYKVTEEEFKELEEIGYITIYGEKYKRVTSINGYEGISLVKDGESELIRIFGIDTKSKLLQGNNQWGMLYRITDRHMKITLSANTLVLNSNEYDMESGTGITVEDLYNTRNGSCGYDDESGNKSFLSLYNFVFKDDKCIELYSIPYES